MHRHVKANRGGLTLLELLIVLTILVALASIVVPRLGFLGRKSQRLATMENLCTMQELIVNRYMADMGELPRPAVDSGGTVLDAGSVSGVRADHPQLRYLFVNPDKTADADPYNDQSKGENMLAGRCWQGPYTMHTGANWRFGGETDPADPDYHRGFTTLYGEPGTTGTGDPTVFDAWGHPIVLQEPTEAPSGITDPDELARIQHQHVRLVSAGEDGVLDTPTDVLMPDTTQRNDDLVVFLFRHDEYGEVFQNLEPQ